MAIIYTKLAARHLQQIYEWYEDQVAGLGEDFLDEIDIIAPHLISFPRSFSVLYKNFRVASLSRFPYLIFYNIDKSNIVIHRIVHAHRNKRKKF